MSSSRGPSTLGNLDTTPRSRLQSRARGSRSVSAASRPFLQDPEVEADAFSHPDGPIATELLSSHHSDAEEACTEELSEEDAQDELTRRPWWKRPSPWWFLILTPFISTARAAVIAPKVEIYIRLACDTHRPDSSAIGQIVHAFSSPDRWESCASDPTVQAAVAKLSLVITISMGVLSCLTTAWWGSLSDRYGRTRVVTCAVIGSLIEDINFLLVCRYSSLLPGGYWLLTCGAIMSGLLGGMSTIGAGVHAYIADCAEPSSRSRFFSLHLGLLFTGFSIGPTLGSVLVGYTHNPVSVFYIAAVLHFVYALLLCFVVPESLTPEQMAVFRREHTLSIEQAKEGRENGGAGEWLKRAFGFLTPLALLLPRKSSIAGARRRDWSLLLLAMGYGFTIALKGDLTYEYQYMSLMFGWTSEQLGYYTSALGTTRAIYLTVLLPVITKLFQSKPRAVQLPADAQEPTSARAQANHPAAFDLTLARLSIVIEVVAYTLMALAPNGYLFTAYAILSTLGIGFTPAVNSVASAVYMQGGGRELGKLFGALGVVQTVSSNVLGPFMFGVTYMKTVATAPQAIFAVSLAALSISFMLLAPIRLHAPGCDVEGREAAPSDEVATGEREPLLARDEERGRAATKR